MKKLTSSLSQGFVDNEGGAKIGAWTSVGLHVAGSWYEDRWVCGHNSGEKGPVKEVLGVAGDTFSIERSSQTGAD